MVGSLLITGASRGIGAATARLAAQRGYAICVNYRSARDQAEALVAELNRSGATAIAVQADVSVESEVKRLFEICDRELGALVGLVNNAGIVHKQARVDSMDSSRITQVLATNVVGPFLCAREAVVRMSSKRGGKGGAIVNVSSRAGQLGAPGEYVDYAASKAALDALTIGLAKEVASEGIRVNGVRPGIINTEIHASGGEPNRVERVKASLPLQRAGTPDEVAYAILWLLSDEASYTTGSFLDVSGGR